MHGDVLVSLMRSALGYFGLMGAAGEGSTERSTRAAGTLHNIHSHYAQAGEFGMIWETLDLTPADVEPGRLGKLDPSAARSAAPT